MRSFWADLFWIWCLNFLLKHPVYYLYKYDYDRRFKIHSFYSFSSISCVQVVELSETVSGSFVQRQKRIAIYHVKKFVKDSQLWKQTLSILPDFLENWHFISHFVWKSTKTLELLRIFDELFDVRNGKPFLTLYKTSA